MAEAHPEISQCEGETVQLFRVRMRGLLRQYVETMSVEGNGIFEVIKGNKSMGKRVHRTMQSEILKVMFDNLDDIIADGQFDENFKTSLVKCKVESNAVAWRPPGNPKEHMRSLDMHEKLKTKKELETFVQEKEASVQKLMAEVEAGRSHVLDLETRLASAIERLKNICFREENEQSILEAQRKLLTKQVQDPDYEFSFQ